MAMELAFLSLLISLSAPWIGARRHREATGSLRGAMQICVIHHNA
jgi:hypothetical protein